MTSSPSSTPSAVPTDGSCRISSLELHDDGNYYNPISHLLSLTDGLVDNTIDLNNPLNVVAETHGDCAGVSVFLALTGPVSQGKWEGVAPYALFGDSSGDLEAGYLDPGEYELSAFPYGVEDENGLTIIFTLNGTGI